MTTAMDALPGDVRLQFTLRALYEQYGYHLYRMAKFEPYDMYRENKNFLRGENIITFSNPNGVLMALKPDVTLSIVKNAKPDVKTQKLYYHENVFRREKNSREYGEIWQMGLEFIGGGTGYAEAEVVALANKSLRATGGETVLNISHMGFVTALLDAAALPMEARDGLLSALRQKNRSGVAAILAQNGVEEESASVLCALATFSQPLAGALPALRALCKNAEMEAAVGEMEALAGALCVLDDLNGVRVDFSVVNDLDYYNGLVFQGYVKGIPRAVMSGGRYDNMMRRLNKPQNALGFALYLDELERALREVKPYDVDAVLLYGNARPEAAAQAAAALLKEGISVRAECEMPENVRARRIYRLLSDGRMEVELHA